MTRGTRRSRSSTLLVERNHQGLSEVTDDLDVGSVDVCFRGDGHVGSDDFSDHSSLFSGDLREDVEEDGEEVLGHSGEEGEVGLTLGLVDSEGGEEGVGGGGGEGEGAGGFDEGLEGSEEGGSEGGLGVEDLGDEGGELVGEGLYIASRRARQD